MTRKLYYEDAYIREFEAIVISCDATDGGYSVVLDRTAFFPEEGGQSADHGYIADARVLNVSERDGVVYHLTDTSVLLGEARCTLNFDERFEKMQMHTAEHILCGIIHRLYGLDNVGFHLSGGEVTFDISAPLTREQLDEVERLANEAVFANIPVTTYFPTPEELPSLEYRAKLDLTEGVRIVNIGDVDSCACCAPHVSYTGEIGLIKMLDFFKHRGGLRITMVAGRRALVDYNEKYRNIREISAILSTPQHDTAATLSTYIADVEELKHRLKTTRLELARNQAFSVQRTEGSCIYFIDGFSMEELIEFANNATSRVGGLLVALSGADGDYKYVIASSSYDMRAEIKRINAALSGRGGGRPNMVQGAFFTDRAAILDYFSENYR